MKQNFLGHACVTSFLLKAVEKQGIFVWKSFSIVWCECFSTRKCIQIGVIFCDFTEKC